MAIVGVGADRLPLPGLAFAAEPPADRKLDLAARSQARRLSSLGHRSGHSPLPAHAQTPAASSPAPSLPHPGPGRAGALRVSRGRAANKVALRGSAATAPGECVQPAGE